MDEMGLKCPYSRTDVDASMLLLVAQIEIVGKGVNKAVL